MAAGGAAVVSAVLTGTLFAQPTPPHPIVPPAPLKSVPVPRPDLSDFVVNNHELVVLGKALFWDMQVGGDGTQACASCHFHAGADNRVTNALNPGANGVFSVRQPGETLQPADFPFHKLANPDDARSTVLRDTDDVVGSQGLYKSHFDGLAPGGSADKCTRLGDAVFGTNRQVTGRNTPTVINAAFNYRNFWDGRAQFAFNTRNPFGDRDPDAKAWVDDGTLHQVRVLIPFSSLASQAVGPPNNSVEMSCDGRTFMLLGKKMLRAVDGGEPFTPLAYQAVSTTDSVLGPYVAPGGRGLKKSYPAMIMDTFARKWWSSAGTVTEGGSDFTLMEANFSLFWGLAIQAYEETLIADETRFDKFLEGSGTLTPQEQRGFGVFMGQGGCIACHGGAELTNAAVSNVVDRGEYVERMIMGDNGIAVYDDGFYNIGVRPTGDDVGLGGLDPFKKPLSLTRLCAPPNGTCQAAITNIAARADEGIAAGPLLAQCPGNHVVSSTSTCDRFAVDGSFKVPGLRNVELTGPYFHNGGQGTLEEVVEFYNRGGDFARSNQNELDPNIKPLGLTADDKAALVAFLKSLTDERVRTEQKPFDHPQLCLANAPAGMPGLAECTRAKPAPAAPPSSTPVVAPAPPPSAPVIAPSPPPSAPVVVPAPQPSAPVLAPASPSSALPVTPGASTSSAPSGTATKPSASARSSSPRSAPSTNNAVSAFGGADGGSQQSVPLLSYTPSRVLPESLPVAPPPGPAASASVPGSDGEYGAPLEAVTTTVLIDPGVGGALSTPDGMLVIGVPAGEEDWLTLSLTDVSSLAGVAPNLQVGSRGYLLAVQDSQHAVVVRFDPPLEITAAVDMTLLTGDQREAGLVLALNPDSGIVEEVSSMLVDDGRTASLLWLGPAPSPDVAGADR